LKDAAEVSRGRFRIRLKSETVDSILADAIEAIESVAKERQITISLDVQCDPFAVVCCDRARIGQAFTNLLANAVRFSRPNSNVVVGIARQQRSLLFSVRDSGPGIAPYDLPHIFEKYWRTPDSRGSGLGLFICKQIIDAHRGILLVDSVVGQGSTFSFV